MFGPATRARLERLRARAATCATARRALADEADMLAPGELPLAEASLACGACARCGAGAPVHGWDSACYSSACGGCARAWACDCGVRLCARCAHDDDLCTPYQRTQACPWCVEVANSTRP